MEPILNQIEVRFSSLRSFYLVSENSDQFIQDLTASQNSLYGYILSLLPDRTAAQDVLQEVSLTAWQKRSDFTAGTSFFAWVSKIAYFHVLSHRRKMSRDRLVFGDEVLDFLAERQLEREEEVSRRGLALKSCLEKLPAAQKQLVEQRYTEGVRVQEIAAREGKSVGAISQTLYRIREVLLKCVEQNLAEGEPA
jgi:RNA polymerase sigma-70 factor (ECF subfamily)